MFKFVWIPIVFLPILVWTGASLVDVVKYVRDRFIVKTYAVLKPATITFLIGLFVIAPISLLLTFSFTSWIEAYWELFVWE